MSPGSAVGGADPDDVHLGGPVDQEPGQLGGVHVAEGGGAHPGVLDGQQLRLVGVPAQDLPGALERRPGLAREQPRRDARGRQEQAQPGGHYCCGASVAGACGVAVAEGVAALIQLGAGGVSCSFLRSSVP